MNGILKRILRGIAIIITTSMAAFAGNYLGGVLRYLLTGSRVQSVQFKYETQSGKKIINTPVITKFYPALFFGLLGKPVWLFVFIGGIYTGALMPERFEKAFWDRFEQFILK